MGYPAKVPAITERGVTRQKRRAHATMKGTPQNKLANQGTATPPERQKRNTWQQKLAAQGRLYRRQNRVGASRG